ncbi:MAG: acetyl-CoA carboxylase, biotin carboxyl carrier protein [Holosporales bacterium]|jgi:acetyl-CoA carboxylase biotin carboxyl carrier protein|nr:acetyl-CoA carboxylase, biotin carboxyl carrier protein [Holosporales bacterium]
MTSTKINEEIFNKLAELLRKNNLNEIEYSDSNIKIRLVSNTVTRENKQDFNNTQPIQIEEAVTTDFSSHPGAVKSPIVGTCYLAPEPGAKNFVSLGDIVEKGQSLLVIEAMKVMNIIKAPQSGKIIHIAVGNAEPIEFGQLLAVIE